MKEVGLVRFLKTFHLSSNRLLVFLRTTVVFFFKSKILDAVQSLEDILPLVKRLLQFTELSWIVVNRSPVAFVFNTYQLP